MELKRIKDLREDNDLLQKDIAKELNVSQQQYSRIENGTNDIRIDSLIKLAMLYKTSTDYILGITNTKTPYPRIKNLKEI